MDALYDQISFLPETMQPTFAALIIIIIGYFLSKILASIVSFILPAKPTLDEIETEEDLSLRTRIVRACFWVSWLIFIVKGLNELTPTSVSLPRPPSSLEGCIQLLLRVFCAYVLLLSERYVEKLYEVLVSFCRSIPLPRENSVFRYIIRNSWLPIFIVGIISLNSPGTHRYKATITAIVLFGGWLLGKVIQEAVGSTFQNKFLAKLSFYLIFVHILIAAFYVWV